MNAFHYLMHHVTFCGQLEIILPYMFGGFDMKGSRDISACAK